MPASIRTRPNFILFITDQHRADFLGCYGHALLRTPHIDSIARRGVAFDRFYVASPVCMPNRSSLMTGRMPSAHGVRCNGVPLALEAVTFVDLLRAAGYRTALVGKSHLQNFSSMPPLLTPPAPRPGYHAPGPELAQAVRAQFGGPAYAQEQPAFWEKSGARIATPFYGFDHVTLVRAHGDAVGGDYDRWLAGRDPNAGKLLGPNNGLPHDYVCPQAHRTAIPAELYSTAFLAEAAQAYLESCGEAPFFLMVSFPDPHHPFNPPGKYWDMYAPADFPVPEAFSRNDWAPPPHVRAILAQRESGAANLSGMNTIAVSAREAQEARALTCGMITCIDDAIGHVLRALDRCGRREETVLMFTSDHGDHLGDHRLMLKGAEHYQGIVRVPFIWSDPLAAPDAPRCAALGSTIDIAATILDRARIEPYVGMQGRSLLPAMPRAGTFVRDAVFIQYDHQAPTPGTNRPPRVHTLIDASWRLSVFDHGEWGELYDLANDPGEFDNLWASAAHATTRARLMERLVYAEIEHVDRVPLPTRRA
ncbi:MAG: sulfatase-like hydrolase/transferase [Proteobacteria bacterium]|nr:sulfatase-like hydrolase/transferase [Pseudomonadota bacterium]